MRRTKQKQIDPKTFKKHSDVVKKGSTRVTVTGKRNQTDTGYIVLGTVCDDFTTYFQHVMEGSMGPTEVNHKRFKAIRVVNGQGIAVVSKDGESRQFILYPGDEIKVAPGIEHAVGSMPKVPLEIFVTQAADYDDHLETLVEAQGTEVPEKLLKEVTRQEALEKNLGEGAARPRRRTSKAAEQQRAEAHRRGRVVSQPEAYSVEQAIAPVMNVKPSMGNLDMEGAG